MLALTRPNELPHVRPSPAHLGRREAAEPPAAAWPGPLVISPGSCRAWSLLTQFHSLFPFSAFLGTFLLFLALFHFLCQPPRAVLSWSENEGSWGLGTSDDHAENLLKVILM